MDDIIIWGCGEQGKKAVVNLRKQYNIVGFADNDLNKIGKPCPFASEFIVLSISDVYRYDAKIFIATQFEKEIIQQLINDSNIQNDNIYIYHLNDSIITLDTYLFTLKNEELENRYRKTLKQINTGRFLQKCYITNFSLDALSFISGSSGVLDYAVLKGIMLLFGFETYLEIGTYIGESLHIVSDVAKRVYSITVPESHPYHMKYWCQSFGMKDWSNKLVNRDNMIQYQADSKEFDFSSIPEKINLYFVDGNHSYLGVYDDTRNIFGSKAEDAIVVWHDFKTPPNQLRLACIQGVEDAIGEEEFKRVYLFDNCLCGIYIPDKYYPMIEDCFFNENDSFYSYKLDITISSI